MPDGTSVPSPARPPATSSATTSRPIRSDTPPGHGLRRSMTVDEAPSPLRRRSTMSHLINESSASFDDPRRRSSNFSEYSFSEARDILNPQPTDSQIDVTESSSLASLSLAFALLPALAGVLFKNGSAVVTDVMLLGLSGVFLHWSVTQPWSWYHSAQETRIQHENGVDAVLEDDSEGDLPTPVTEQAPSDHHGLQQEQDAKDSKHGRGGTERHLTRQQQSALAELYIYEVIALLSCFILPIIGAYLLHAIRSQLSRPSEGLVSNYNLTIFLLVSELRVFSHMIKLVQSRTLHLQRVVHEDPFGPKPPSNAEQFEDLIGRMERLESRSTAEELLISQATNNGSAKSKQDTTIARDVRNAIQPELDALNRAVRRYEKKATLLQFQTESRFSNLDARLEDAIALAANAVKNSSSRKNAFVWAIESTVAMILVPFKAIIRIIFLPLEAILVLVKRGKKGKTPNPPTKAPRGSRNGKPITQPSPRYSGDRVPTRVAKR